VLVIRRVCTRLQLDVCNKMFWEDYSPTFLRCDTHCIQYDASDNSYIAYVFFCRGIHTETPKRSYKLLVLCYDRRSIGLSITFLLLVLISVKGCNLHAVDSLFVRSIARENRRRYMDCLKLKR
jgi:hypothetical protein